MKLNHKLKMNYDDSKYAITRESYDKVADIFAQKHADPKSVAQLMDPFVHRVPLGGVLLDVGCGPGRDASILLQRGLRVIGVDFSKEMVRIAKSVPGFDVRFGDLRDLDFDDESFDGIWANASLHHLDKEDVEPTLVEFKRLLKPEGVIFVSVKRGPLEGFTEEYPSCPRFFKKYWFSSIGEVFDKLDLRIYHSNTYKGGAIPPEWLYIYAIKPRETQLLLDFGCRFCRIVEEIHNTKDNLKQVDVPIYDRLLHMSQRFAVLPALGHLVEGYTMVISKEHVPSVGALSSEDLKELQNVKTHLRQIMEPEFGPIVFFEHGSVVNTISSGASVIHAHIHAAPWSSTFWKDTSSPHFSAVDGINYTRDSFARRKTYLFVEDSNGVCYGCRPQKGLPSQYLRRQLAREAGEQGCWNWRYYPFLERVSATIERLQNRYGRYTF